MRIDRFAAALALSLGFHSGASVAAEACVPSAPVLGSVLQIFGANGQPDVIRIQAGNYATPALGFSYTAGLNDRSQPITISGGWNVGCTEQVAGPTGTTLTGNAANSVLRFASANGLPWAAPISVSNLTIQGGGGDRGGLSLDGESHLGASEFRRLVIRNNSGTFAGAMTLVTGGTLLLENNLVVGNEASAARGIGSIFIEAGGAAALVNNTFVGNLGGQPGAALALGTGAGDRVLVQNNWFQNAGAAGAPSLECANAGGSEPNTNVRIAHNAIDLAACDGATVLASVPASEDVFDNFAPGDDSLLIDTGSQELADHLAPWTPALDAIDLHGGPRVYGEAVDIGAIEMSLLSDGFEATN